MKSDGLSRIPHAATCDFKGHRRPILPRLENPAMFATLVATALTAQIISQAAPKTGDHVALVEAPAVRGWSAVGTVDSEPDRSVPSGTLAIFQGKTSTRAERPVTRAPRNPAMEAGSAAAAHAIAQARREAIAAAYAFHYRVRIIPSNEPFTCFNGPVWVIHSLDQAKAVYAQAAAELAQVEAKKLTGDRKRIQAIRNRKWAAAQGRLSRQFGLSPQALEAILACGRTNQWPIVKGAAGGK